MSDSSSERAAQEREELRERCEQLEAEVARLAKVEQEFQERELIYRQAIQAAGGVPYQLDVQRHSYIYLDPNIEHLLGYPAEEVNADLWKRIGKIERMRGSMANHSFAEIREAYDGGKLALWQADYRVTTRQGETRWLADSAISVRDAEGNVVESLGFLQDVTDRVLTEKALLESEARFRTFLESVQLIAVQLDASGTIHFVNSYLLNLTGWQGEDLLGKNWFDVFTPEEEREAARAGFLERIAHGILAPTVENSILTCSGEKRLIAWHDALLRGDQGYIEGVASLGVDITESRRLEEQLLHSQKIESIGRLAGGIAHDFNNLLTAILGYTELAILHHPEDTELQSHLRSIEVAGQRAADLTRQLLGFARKQIIAPRVINLNELANNLDAILRRLLGEDIHFVWHLTPDLGTIKADPGQIEQVLINLCINARDAMPEGGRLTIETRNVTLDAEDAPQYPDVTPGDYVMLAVSDTGTGMDAETQRYIFEPFYTTKGQGKGTGLGLATCHGIVSQNGGHIGFTSAPGVGTTFRVYLPRTVGAAAATEPVERAAPQGRGTILLVEDEPIVRAFAEQALRQQGYKVLTAANGLEALRIAEQYPEGFDLLLTDVVMPHLGGVQLAEQFAQQYPAVKVLFMSGYTDNAILQDGTMSASIAFLQKPYTPLTLTRKVWQVMNETPPQPSPL